MTIILTTTIPYCDYDSCDDQESLQTANSVSDFASLLTAAEKIQALANERDAFIALFTRQSPMAIPRRIELRTHIEEFQRDTLLSPSQSAAVEDIRTDVVNPELRNERERLDRELAEDLKKTLPEKEKAATLEE